MKIGKESSLIPTLRLAKVSSECFSLDQGKSAKDLNFYSCTLLRICHWVSLSVMIAPPFLSPHHVVQQLVLCPCSNAIIKVAT